MKIGIISDTHNKIAGIDTAFRIFEVEKVELIIHCGDWTTVDTVQYLAHKAAQLGLPSTPCTGKPS